jgi:anaphase-promoting complex subunit 2
MVYLFLLQDQVPLQQREQQQLEWTAYLLARAPATLLDELEHCFRQWLLQHSEEIQQDDSATALLTNLLQTLGWFEFAFVQQPLQKAVAFRIQQIARDLIQGDYETPNLLQVLLSECQQAIPSTLQQINLEENVRSLFGQVRLEELFEMVADYPDSKPAVQDLQTLCLSSPRFAQQLTQSLKQTLIRRLCHPGAETTQIMQMYIHTIHCLRVWGLSSAAVTTPVRTYLREQRSDTVRCIITSLTTGDLYEELRKPQALEHMVEDEDDEEEPPTMEWQPKPSIFHPVAGHDSEDILALLVSIYGSKEVFVNEYRLMLADKLLNQMDYQTDSSVHTLELLKLRFGEQSMRHCEVMVKDIDDSKRTNAQIKEELRDSVVDSVIVSHIFWPKLQKERLQHHPRLQTPLDEYNRVFSRLKNPRQLVWFSQLGTVDIELDVLDKGGEIVLKKFSCTPLQVTLLLHFEDQSIWKLSDLSNETSVPENVLQKRLSYWIGHRIIRHTDADTYEIVLPTEHHHHENAETPEDHHMHSDEGNSSAVSLTAHEDEEMQVFESYVVGMLTNMGSLPLARIHQMLKMFVTGSEVVVKDPTPQQLAQFLQKLVAQNKLECGPDGMYKLYGK